MIIAQRTENGIVSNKIDNPARSKSNYAVVDLGTNSELTAIIRYADMLDITDYRKGAVKKHHCDTKNEYIIPKELLEADFVINVPKLKTALWEIKHALRITEEDCGGDKPMNSVRGILKFFCVLDCGRC